MIIRIQKILPSALYLFMLEPILFDDISKCCDKYGKPLYYLLLLRISVILYKLAYLIRYLIPRIRYLILIRYLIY